MTGHEQLLAELEAERRRLEVILRQLPAMVLVFGADGRIVRANDQYLAAVGMSADHVIGRHARDLPTQVVDEAGRMIPPEELPSTRALRGEDVTAEVGVRWPSGERWFQVTGAPIRGDGGTIDGAVLTMRDITVDRESAAALRASEARHRALLDAIPDSLYRISRDGVVLERRAPNDGRAVVRQSYVGHTLDELLGPETGGRLRDGITRTLETGQPQVVEYERPGPGEPYYREARMVPLCRDEVLALVRDIGPRKRAEQEREQLLETIERDRRRLDAILRQLPNALIVFDNDGRIVLANDALIATLGLPKEQVIGRHSSELGSIYLTPDGRVLAREELPSSHAFRGEEFDGELRVERAGGSRGWIQVSAAPVRDEDGAITGVILATRDITAEREAVEALRASEERTRALLNAVPDSLYVNDRDGVILDFKPPSDGRPMLFGPDAIGRRVGELWPPEVADTIVRMTNAALDSGEVQVREYEVPTPVGHGYREARVVPYGTDRTLSLVRDVDARKRAELALQALNEQLEQRVRDRTAELEAANAELEAFSYSVSHDLKAPLRGIDGYSRLLWEDYQDRLDEDGRFLLGSVRQATAQMHQLIDDLLAYSRLERRAVDDAEVELRPIVDGLLAERAEEVDARSVRVDLAVPDISVRADRDGLAQAFRNLLDNALRFTADVPEPRIEIRCTVEPARCVLSVRDNGIGFDMQYHDRIFEIFQRLHRQEEYPGTGIGLALVRKAMQRMGGRAWAESSPGAGATFYLELPR